MKNIAVILAGGVGSRLNLGKPKQFLKVAGRTVFEHTVEVFSKHKSIDEIFIVMHQNFISEVETMVQKNGWKKVKKILGGGSERYKSSLVAINSCTDENANLVFHDAVRPLINDRIIDDCLHALSEFDAVDVAIPAVDTIIELDESKEFIKNIPNRNYLFRGQTPQAFKLKTIKKAYEIALKDPNLKTTDDCGIVKKYLPETKIFVVKGEESNIKLTYPEDIYLLDKLFQLKSTTLSKRINLKNLKDKVMVVFGGNSGIGMDMIKIAKKHGTKCYSFSRSSTNTDISDIKSVKSALKSVFEKEGKIDFVVNSAAILNKEPINHLNIKTIKQIIDINYVGMVNVVLASFEYLKVTKGQILNFTSSSYTRGRANYALYSSTKSAVVNFTQAIAEEWQDDGIKINCINPQRTKTAMRISNFGIEPANTLLKSQKVAEISLKTLLSEFSGEVIDIKIAESF
ncbi:bifunctional cytidylyltransferase/SDR family oxidoreductase [Campylobacter sp. JMF_01 NE2]|uniref:bifunctional cytidylyltransferase/SDR family oxidoreductase n=1 Tax=unclassified Campylobacter TaxID=2593542 RepID=UPI0022EA069A|nr:MULTISPECIES: bifunctional cytidylyltransferase/SDR family oxidoreductase [unclassified Campylobacter]MDA3053086.1 bifunctional cytidylyltransferase/SDR family oxidoreductase [Campylobacter sp. JMF_03 NE3]MDA3067417.1 bifunctional cytidylyltransferase/SDR family oxidoreductase [Campylobacter sp. JMF_01 NE2]